MGHRALGIGHGAYLISCLVDYPDSCRGGFTNNICQKRTISQTRPAIYYGRSIGHDITTLENRYITRRAQVKTNIEDGNLVYLPNGQAAKSGLNKSMLDVAHGQFTTVIKYVAGKLGKSVVFVDPKGSSQHWWNCLNKVPKEL